MNTARIRSISQSAIMLLVVASLPAAAQSLSANEVRGTRLSDQWKSGQGVVTRGADGKVIFLFGEVQPSVVCSPLQVCDIELQAGEIVRDVLLGDTVRWKVEPATSGPAGGQAVHLIVKPAESGLVTSMVVTTSRRAYHIQLKSHHIRYMAKVGFEYPQDADTRFAEINARMQTSVLPGTSVPSEQLDFAFKMRGTARWKPSRIYSDGDKTYIQFPSSLSGQDAPVLFVVSGGENRIVNYRLKGALMVVDYNIDHAILVSGVGRHQQKITIRRGG
ncbi:P-type conjugative transfer protein TrbG [Mesorhizobium sp. CAU 1741]|uniref:P-type conjugative transfer protein TrbG n=1 Tax=Mesorhizobium sp. CAU 1741 TaxID=3140366 RepID=UPI00325B90C3